MRWTKTQILFALTLSACGDDGGPTMSITGTVEIQEESGPVPEGTYPLAISFARDNEVTFSFGRSIVLLDGPSATMNVASAEFPMPFTVEGTPEGFTGIGAAVLDIDADGVTSDGDYSGIRLLEEGASITFTLSKLEDPSASSRQ